MVDRYVGIPLVATLALTKKRQRPADEEILRIGILKTAAVGDTLLLAGIPDAIKRRFPGVEAVIITGRDNAAAVPLLGRAVDRHVAIDVKQPFEARRRLRALELDVLLECGPWPRVDALLGALYGARYRVGFAVPKQWRHFGFDAVVSHDRSAHQLENFRNLARAIGVTDFSPPALDVPDVSAHDERGRFAIFHPWSGGFLADRKEWPIERWVELGAAVGAEGRIEVLVSGSDRDRERSDALVRRLSERGVIARSIAGTLTLAQLGATARRAEFMVTVNTGVMHLAALAGARVVSLDGPVASHRWGPVGKQSISLGAEGRCGYIDLGFEDGPGDCMARIPASAVVDAINDLASRNLDA
jgi:heptosyltransferase I